MCVVQLTKHSTLALLHVPCLIIDLSDHHKPSRFVRKRCTHSSASIAITFRFVYVPSAYLHGADMRKTTRPVDLEFFANSYSSVAIASYFHKTSKTHFSVSVSFLCTLPLKNSRQCALILLGPRRRINQLLTYLLTMVYAVAVV